MSNTALIPGVPFGAFPTISGLRALDASTMTEGVQVAVNGAVFQRDGGQATFVFNASNTGLDDGRTVIATPTTGRWVILDAGVGFSGLATPATVSYSGLAENFTLLSGAGSSTLIYTFAPSYTVNPNVVTIKQLGTGQVRLQATGNDFLWDTAGTTAVSSITFQSSGASYNFRATYNPAITGGIFYRV